MSDMFKDLMDKAKEALDPFVDKAKEAVESGELKDKADAVIDAVKDKAGDVIDKVKDVATQAMTGDKPALDIKNELFGKLGEEVAENKDAIAEKAAEMEQKIQDMLGGNKPE